MIDIHCHILPGLDDGASSTEQSLEMAKYAIEDGIHTVIATPHTENGVYFNPACEVRKQVGILRKLLEDADIPLTLCPGCEVRLCSRMSERIRNDEITTINDTGRYILLEFPDYVFPERYEQEIFDLRLGGITPIIAHPERNSLFEERKDILFKLVSAGCLVQLTASSITGDFGEDCAGFSHYLLEHRMAHVIATDAHGWGNRNKPSLSRAVEIAARVMGNQESAEALVTLTPHAILTGSPVRRSEPETPKKKNWFSNLW